MKGILYNEYFIRGRFYGIFYTSTLKEEMVLWLSIIFNSHVSLHHIQMDPNEDSVQFSSVQLLSRVQLFVTPWITAHHTSLSITNSWSLPKLMSIESVMPSSHLIFCHPLLLLPPIPPSIRLGLSKTFII